MQGQLRDKYKLKYQMMVNKDERILKSGYWQAQSEGRENLRKQVAKVHHKNESLPAASEASTSSGKEVLGFYFLGLFYYTGLTVDTSKTGLNDVHLAKVVRAQPTSV